jgi:O-antigen/teichoic acid export membrane protein
VTATTELPAQAAPAPGARRVLTGAFCAALQPLILNAVSVPVLAFVVQSLGRGGYGQFAVATSLAATFSFLADLGLRGRFVRGVACDPGSAARAAAEGLALRALLGAAAASLAVLTAVCLGYPAGVVWCTSVAAVGMVFTAVSTVTADLFQATHRLPTLAAVNMAAGVVLSAASVAAVLAGAGPFWVSVAYLLGPLTSAALSLAIVHRYHFPIRLHWDTRRFRSLIYDARHFTAQRALLVLDMNAEALLVPKLVGVPAMGLFAVGTLLVDRLLVIPDGLGSALYPAMSQAYRRGRGYAAREAVRCLSLTLTVCTPVVLLAYPGSAFIATVFFPAQAEACRQIICLTMWVLPLAGIDHAMTLALNAAGKDAEQARLALAAGVVNPLLAVALVSYWGLAGACWSYVLRFAIRAAFRTPCFVRTFSPRLSEMRLGGVLASNALMAALMWLAHGPVSAWRARGFPGMDPGGWPTVLAASSAEAALGALSYAAALVALGVVSPADLGLVRRTRRRFAG